MKRSSNKKIHVCIVCGGISPEHTISIASAASVYSHLDKEKYDVTTIGIGKNEGEWRYYGSSKFYKDDGVIDSFKLLDDGWHPCSIKPGPKPCFYYDDKGQQHPFEIDIVFPVIHGDNGEDGRLQGLIELLSLPIAGCGTLASAVGMDKDLTKMIAAGVGVKVVPWILYDDLDKFNLDAVVSKLGMPFFVKPSASGSSCGIHKVKDRTGAMEAVRDAFKYSAAVMAEKSINAREIEVSVLGRWSGDVIVSVPGEIKPNREFYDYEAKYIDKNGADLVIPADIDNSIVNEIRSTAEKVFRALRCNGMSRIDFFVDKDTNEVFFNEVNTIPGFTVISMYPKLFAASGIPYENLLDRLIIIGLEEFNARK